MLHLHFRQVFTFARKNVMPKDATTKLYFHPHYSEQYWGQCPHLPV